MCPCFGTDFNQKGCIFPKIEGISELVPPPLGVYVTIPVFRFSHTDIWECSKLEYEIECEFVPKVC